MKAWWQTCSTHEFKEKLRDLKRYEIEALVLEIKAAFGVTSMVETDYDANDDWKKRARHAAAFMEEKRLLSESELLLREGQDIESLIRTAIEQIRLGNADVAIEMLNKIDP